MIVKYNISEVNRKIITTLVVIGNNVQQCQPGHIATKAANTAKAHFFFFFIG